MQLRIEGKAPLAGKVVVPADKSITHRSLMMAALAEGFTRIEARAAGEDNHSTAKVLRDLGVSIKHSGHVFEVEGKGPRGLVAPKKPLDCGNSGTTMRLLTGILAGAGVEAELVGDGSLMGRPMGRVCKPLRALGVDISGTEKNGRELPPVRLGKGGFRGGEAVLDIASAQVKSCILLAGLCSGKAVTVREPSPSRDHTERMLNALGATIKSTSGADGHVLVSLAADQKLAAESMRVPGDFSSSAFLLAAGLLVPDSKVSVADVGVNPTRTGLLEIFEEYGGKITVTNWLDESGEPTATVTAENSSLVATRPGEGAIVVGGPIIPRLIDELVVLAAVASQANGETLVKDAQELRVKESDRVRETVRLVQAFGADAEERPDGFVVRGPRPLRGARIDVSADHRLALTAAVLAVSAEGESVLDGFEIAAVSYPDFVKSLEALGAKVRVA